MSFNGTKYETFREAAVHKGLLQSDEYMDNCLAEAVLFQMPYSLLTLFALLLVYGIAGDPQRLWDKYYSSMSEDFSRPSLLTEEHILSETISAVDIILASMDKSISDFTINLPSTPMCVSELLSRDYLHEKSINLSDDDIRFIDLLNTEQRVAFDLIVERINAR